VIFSNNPRSILNYTKNILNCDIHTRERTKKVLKLHGGEKIYSLADILAKPIGNSGYNADYVLLGSNKSTETEVKLFTRDTQPILDEIQVKMKELSGKTVEVMVYSDSAFKVPVGNNMELADTVV